MYPPVPTLTRICVQDYKMKNTDVVIEKDTSILISTLGLQRDPEYFPNPDKFDPERFSEENKKIDIHLYIFHSAMGQEIALVILLLSNIQSIITT